MGPSKPECHAHLRTVLECHDAPADDARIQRASVVATQPRELAFRQLAGRGDAALLALPRGRMHRAGAPTAADSPRHASPDARAVRSPRRADARTSSRNPCAIICRSALPAARAVRARDRRPAAHIAQSELPRAAGLSPLQLRQRLAGQLAHFQRALDALRIVGGSARRPAGPGAPAPHAVPASLPRRPRIDRGAQLEAMPAAAAPSRAQRPQVQHGAAHQQRNVPARADLADERPHPARTRPAE